MKWIDVIIPGNLYFYWCNCNYMILGDYKYYVRFSIHFTCLYSPTSQMYLGRTSPNWNKNIDRSSYIWKDFGNSEFIAFIQELPMYPHHNFWSAKLDHGSYSIVFIWTSAIYLDRLSSDPFYDNEEPTKICLALDT